MPCSTRYPVQKSTLALLMAVSIGATLVCPSIGAEPAAEPLTLRYRFSPDQTVHYTVEQESQDFYKRGEAQQQVNYGTTTWKNYRVVSVDDAGNAVLELQIDRVVLKASEDGSDEIRFDTQAEEAPPSQFVGVLKTVGQPMARVKISSQGAVVSQGEKGLMEWLLSDVPDPGPDSLSDMNLLIPLPEKPVKVGEVWKEPFDMQVQIELTKPLQRTVKLQRQYRVESVEGSQAIISFATAVLTPLQDPAQEAQIIKKLASGKVVFDLHEGLIVSRTSRVDAEVVGFNGPSSEIRNITTRTEEVRRQ